MYTCPMHPEILTERPGSCPICGMALEPQTVAVGGEVNPELLDMKRRFWVSAFLTLPVFLLAMSESLPGASALLEALSSGVLAWIQLLLVAPVVLWGALPFFVQGLAIGRDLESEHVHAHSVGCVGCVLV